MGAMGRLGIRQAATAGMQLDERLQLERRKRRLQRPHSDIRPTSAALPLLHEKRVVAVGPSSSPVMIPPGH